jgi:hypothetical protein
MVSTVSSTYSSTASTEAGDFSSAVSGGRRQSQTSADGPDTRRWRQPAAAAGTLPWGLAPSSFSPTIYESLSLESLSNNELHKKPKDYLREWSDYDFLISSLYFWNS